MKYIWIIGICTLMSCAQDKSKGSVALVDESGEENLIPFLDSIWDFEQIPIRLRDSLGRVYGYESAEYKFQDSIYHQNHQVNEKKILELLDQQGWPDKERTGERGNLTICNVLQHSDLSIREKFIPLMKEAVKQKKLEARFLARAEDRIATDKGELQIYGGQIKYYPESKSFDVWPIKDPANVDARRAEIGLDPMADFLKSRRDPMEWDVEKQIERSKEFERLRKASKE